MAVISQYFLNPLSPILAMVGGGVLLTLLECLTDREQVKDLKWSVAIFTTVASLYFTLSLWKTGVASPLEPADLAPWLKAFSQFYIADSFTYTFFTGIHC